MPRGFWCPVAVLAATLIVGASVNAVRADEAAQKLWVAYQGLEERALDDYRNALTISEVIENGRQLKAMARSSDFAERHPDCGAAADTLSNMVTSHYYSRRRLAVPADWHAFSAQYAQHRDLCLVDLKVDAREHSLPSWFGK